MKDLHGGVAGMRVGMKQLGDIEARLRWAKVDMVVAYVCEVHSYLAQGYVMSFYAKQGKAAKYLLIKKVR